MGVGVDTKATGVVMTPFYIKIVQLRLEHMGTSKTKVTIYETDLLPLMDHETFGKWAASCKPNKKNKNKNSLKSKITAFAKETTMYQKKADGEVPSGLVALYGDDFAAKASI